MDTTILIVEDEQAIRELIKLNLSLEGFNCICAATGTEAADYLEEHDCDLVLLDIMLPEINGYELLEYIKPLGIPVIFLTARGSLEERINGLNFGAEDYIVKPFEVAELIARVNVVLRRFNKRNEVLSFNNITMDMSSHIVTVDEKEVFLTPKEFDLLEYLITNSGRVITKSTLYEKVWDEEYDDTSRTLDLHIQRLRKKTGLVDNIKTIYKSGYRLDP